MRYLAVPALVVVAVVATGCGLAPHYQRPVVVAPARFGDADWLASEPSETLPRGPWWERYGDAELDALEGRLESGSPELAVAAARYAQARALAIEAGAARYPSVTAGGLATRDRQSDNRPLRSASQPAEYRDYALGGAASYEVDFWGRVRNLASIGVAASTASAADLATARLSLQAELATDYLTLRGVDAELKLLRDAAEAYQRALVLTRSRHDGGVASGLDVARAETQLEGARALVIDLSARRALYRHAIARLVGAMPTEFELPEQPSLPVVPVVPLGLPSELVERRPDVAAAERRVAAANASIGVARAAYFPRVVLGASGGYEDTGVAGWLTAPNRFWAIGPAAALALFDAGYRRAEVARAHSGFDEAAAHYRATVLSAFQDVADNLALLGLLRQEAAQQSKAVEAARRALELASNRYVEGAVNYLEVVVAQTAALQAEHTQLTLEVRQLDASVGLIRGLGGGWSVAELPTVGEARSVGRPAASH